MGYSTHPLVLVPPHVGATEERQEESCRGSWVLGVLFNTSLEFPVCPCPLTHPGRSLLAAGGGI